MTQWMVTDADGAEITRFGIDAVADARHAAFNHLVKAAKPEGGLSRLNEKSGEWCEVCTIDTVNGTYNTPGLSTAKPICRKLTLLADDEWLIVDAGLVDFENVKAYCVLNAVDPGDYLIEEPMLYHATTFVDTDKTAYYAFTKEERPRSFPIWACEGKGRDE